MTKTNDNNSNTGNNANNEIPVGLVYAVAGPTEQETRAVALMYLELISNIMGETAFLEAGLLEFNDSARFGGVATFAPAFLQRMYLMVMSREDYIRYRDQLPEPLFLLNSMLNSRALAKQTYQALLKHNLKLLKKFQDDQDKKKKDDKGGKGGDGGAAGGAAMAA
jgi:hypothetical protein